jgi:gamma-glutamyl-gamma-aminobutyrate hydrolase PuuD
MRDAQLVLGYMPFGTGEVFPFDQTFGIGVNLLEEGFDDVDAIVIWGGTDISSSYYKEKPHSMNQNRVGQPSQRDINEWKAMKYAYSHDIPIIGVCRGAQFLCVFSGGTLVQHVTGHVGCDHDVVTSEGEIMETSSCHHQMMFPYNLHNYELLAWSNEGRSTVYQGEGDVEIEAMKHRAEAEVVYFPQTKGLAIQGHPEWMKADAPFVKWCNRMVVDKLMQAAIA